MKFPHLVILIAIVATSILYLTLRGVMIQRQNDRLIHKIDSLSIKTKEVLKFDSIRNLQDQAFLDSLNHLKAIIEDEINTREKESRALRIKNQELERRYRSVVVPDRPEF